MNLEHLFEQYINDNRSKRIAAALQKKQQAALQVKGLIGSQTAWVVAAVNRLTNHPFLIIASDKEEAAFLQNDISALGAFSKEALFFPDSYRRPSGFDKLDRTNVLQRTETISKLVAKPKAAPIIVTYPEAIFEKVVAPSNLQKSAIEVQVGTELDVPFLVEILIEYGFVRVDFVYEPGQFSVRGGIVDIYSYGNEYPYRVDLFDVIVESIRTFDPTSQLSTKRIDHVTIIPNVNTQFDAAQKVSIFEVLPETTAVWVLSLIHI